MVMHTHLCRGEESSIWKLKAGFENKKLDLETRKLVFEIRKLVLETKILKLAMDALLACFRTRLDIELGDLVPE